MSNSNAPKDPGRAPVLAGRHSYGSINDRISDAMVVGTHRRGWWTGFLASFALAMVFFYGIGYLFAVGTGIWGIDIPVAWGWAITNFVWWIGIGHAGTFISAFLLLLRQEWRTSINRFAEAMTLFAAGIAALWPILHLGRPWFFYWLFPYPNSMELWPQWRSVLVWDVFAIGTYLLVSLLFWYLGLIPDLATLRDRAAKRWQQVVYGLFALGWRNDARHWARHKTAYLLMAGLATPLVISVHSIVSFDFATAHLPGWHNTVMPPFFVAGALFSGFAMVLTLAIPLRRAFGLHDFITARHLDHAAKIILVTGLLVTYGYLNEAFFAWYSGDPFHIAMMKNRFAGPYAEIYWSVIACNAVAVQALWFRRVRRHVVGLFVLSLVINVGMWLERYMIIVTTLHRDYLPAAWGMFSPTAWDWAMLIGSIGLFFALFFLFVRGLPAISLYEMRHMLHERREEQ